MRRTFSKVTRQATVINDNSSLRHFSRSSGAVMCSATSIGKFVTLQKTQLRSVGHVKRCAGCHVTSASCLRPIHGPAPAAPRHCCDCTVLASWNTAASQCGVGHRIRTTSRTHRQCHTIVHGSSSSSVSSSGDAPAQPTAFEAVMMAYLQLQQQQQAAADEAARKGNGSIIGATVDLQSVSFHPPGSEVALLQDVSLHLPPNKLGLIMGRSGSGKTTLLQLLAGFMQQNEGRVHISGGSASMDFYSGSSSSTTVNGSSPAVGAAVGSAGVGQSAGVLPPQLEEGPEGTSMEARMQRVGLVFQFPERHFLGDDLYSELTFAWPRQPQYFAQRQETSIRMQQVLNSVGLDGIPLHVSPVELSGGQQRRLALAIQLVRRPSLLLLDEPLAGLDWKARAEVVALLGRLKSQATLLVVSHDLREVAPLVDYAWRMQLGGRCESMEWPPPPEQLSGPAMLGT